MQKKAVLQKIVCPDSSKSTEPMCLSLSFDVIPKKKLSEITADDVPPGFEPEDVALDENE